MLFCSSTPGVPVAEQSRGKSDCFLVLKAGLSFVSFSSYTIWLSAFPNFYCCFFFCILSFVSLKKKSYLEDNCFTVPCWSLLYSNVNQLWPYMHHLPLEPPPPPPPFGFVKIALCCSAAKSCLTLSDPMNSSTPGFPVLHCLPEFAQTHVHWVRDAIQPSHPLSPLLLLSSVFPSIRVFSSESALCIRWHQVLELEHQSFQWIFRVDFLQDWLVSSPCSSGDSQESFPVPQFESSSSLILISLHPYHRFTWVLFFFFLCKQCT